MRYTFPFVPLVTPPSTSTHFIVLLPFPSFDFLALNFQKNKKCHKILECVVIPTTILYSFGISENVKFSMLCTCNKHILQKVDQMLEELSLGLGIDRTLLDNQYELCTYSQLSGYRICGLAHSKNAQHLVSVYHVDEAHVHLYVRCAYKTSVFAKWSSQSTAFCKLCCL